MLKLDWNLLFTLINLVVLYLLMKKFLIGPITGIMEKRKVLIEEGLQDAGAKQDAALQMKEKYEASLQGAKSESIQIVEGAKADAKKEYERIVSEAEEKAAKTIKAAQETIDVERAQTMKALKSEIAGLAMTAAAKIVQESSETTNNQNIYNQFLEEVGDVHEDTDNK